MDIKPFVSAVLLASGNGSRFGSELPKQYQPVNNIGQTVLYNALKTFSSHPLISEIILVNNPDFHDIALNTVKEVHSTIDIKIIDGGDTRSESSYAGIQHLHANSEYVLIHDAARPFVSMNLITDVIQKLSTAQAVNVAIPETDTVIEVDSQNTIVSIPRRETIWRVQTPQGFHRNIINAAFVRYNNENSPFPVTDDISLVFHYNICPVSVVEGDPQNKKITFKNDL